MKKIYLEGINSRINEVKGWISELEDRGGEKSLPQNRIMRKDWNADRLRDIWDKVKCTNIHNISVSEGEGKKKPEKIFEEMIVENFSNMRKKTVTKVQEAQKDPGGTKSNQVGKKEYQKK